MRKFAVGLVIVASAFAWLSMTVTAGKRDAIPTVLQPTLARASDLPVGDYQRVVLVSWDGVQRDILYDLLETSDASQPCWKFGTIFPVDTGRVDGLGAPIYTCMPTLAGLKPGDASVDSPTFGPYQIIASHTTNDGQTLTKPQHASMLSGYNTTDHGILENVSTARMPIHATIYERLMDAYDPIPPGGKRNGYIFRTSHAASKKYIGSSITYWAKSSRALQIVTGHGNEEPGDPGPLSYAKKALDKWRLETDTLGLPEPHFLMFMQFKYPDITGHINGEESRQYREAIVETDARLYHLMDMLSLHGWGDAAIVLTTDHGFHDIHHLRNGGRDSFNTWIAAYNVHLNTDNVPLRTAEDYCASTSDPANCLANGPLEPMPDRDIVPNVYVTFVVPTILDMFGVDWSGDPLLKGQSLYQPVP